MVLNLLGQSPMGTAQGPNLTGQAGVPQGPTWGNMLSAAMQYGSKKGSSGAAFAPLVAGTENPGGNNMLDMKSQRQQSNDQWGSIWDSLMKLAIGG